jgi:hypothetical protein
MTTLKVKTTMQATIDELNKASKATEAKHVEAIRDLVLNPSTRKTSITDLYKKAVTDVTTGSTNVANMIGGVFDVGAAWVALAICGFFGCEYETTTSTRKLANVNVVTLAGAIPPEALVSTIAKVGTNDVIVDLKALTLLAQQLQKFVDELNKMNMPLEMKTLLTVSQTGGSLESDLDFRGIASAIKHNNYMLYNYAINTSGSQYNVNKYTVEMHGGGNMRGGARFDVEVSQSPSAVKDSDGKLNPLESKSVGSLNYDYDDETGREVKGYIDSIVNHIHAQLEALRGKSKRLSKHSNDKVATVIKAMVDNQNDVLKLIESLNADNFYPVKGVEEVEFTDAKTDPKFKENDQLTRMKRFYDTVKQKNKSDLRGLAVLEGLIQANKDALGLTSVGNKRIKV